MIIKVGVPIMLIRNIDQATGFCNRARLMVTQLAPHVIQVEVLTRSNVGEEILIPRMVLSPSESKWPFKLKRK